ncbi:MAG: hypothetical protein HOD06_01655 [Candidatus Komeilibacteria bacterium]|jgi:hypothetical protein|nr:hypothetical protein [Candidatus Komeilibacteria bacterium]
MKKYILAIIIIIGLGLLWRHQIRQPDLIEVDLPAAKEYQEFVEQELAEDKDNLLADKIKEEVGVLDEISPQVEVVNVNLDVPFTSQAPTVNWDPPYQDACEEASFLMVDYYYKNKQLPNEEDIEVLLSSMVIWQETNWGGHFDLPVAKLAEYINIFYDYRAEVISNVTINQLEDFLDQGLPIIVPANGHILNNPFFNGVGPEYHMLVIKGYVDNNFITNDPGTSRGADFVYTYENMMESIFDWDTKKSSSTGPRNVLVLYND